MDEGMEMDPADYRGQPTDIERVSWCPDEGQTPVQFLRDISARQSCLRQLAQAHDRFSELEQIARAQGDAYDAEGAHRYALWTLRAYRAEMDDREPE
jgi:hypothetical protein